MKVNLLLIVLLFTVSFMNAEEKKFGKKITVKEKTAVSKLLSAPDKFNGKNVLVEGVITDVCQDQGCWIDLAGDKEGETIRVKVKDGEIAFPKDSKGKTAIVQGKLAAVKGEECSDKESKDASCCSKEKAGEKKESMSKKDDCCSKEKTAKLYQLEGTGAVIKS